MSCLNPSRVLNPRFRKLVDLDIGIFPSFKDPYILVPCGRCFECLKRRKMEWRVRLTHEMMYSGSSCLWVTLTFAPEFYDEFKDEPRLAIRRFLDRIRKDLGHSVRHWFITELGDENERLHFHGFVWDWPLSYDEFRSYWSYGFSWVKPVEMKHIRYATDYAMDFHEEKPDFYPKIFCSPGLGRGYCENVINRNFHLSKKGVEHDVHFVYLSGLRYRMPRYYSSLIFSEARRKSFQRYLEKNPSFTSKSLNGIKYDPDCFYERDGVVYPGYRQFNEAQRELLAFTKKFGFYRKKI